jgi:Zn-dependent protease
MEFDLVTGIKWYLVFLFSTTLHEAAHAWAALKLGDDTAYRGGQVSLDPTPHLKREPVGMAVVPILSYLAGGWMIGWASAPYNIAWALQYPKRSALMALAGPAANLFLVLLAALGIHAGMAAGVFHPPTSPGWMSVTVASQDGIFTFLATMLSLTFSLNLLLCVFNLLPLPPLDGSSLALFFLGGETARKYAEFIRHPSLGLVGLFLGWKLFGTIFPPIQLWAVNLLYWGRHYA